MMSRWVAILCLIVGSQAARNRWICPRVTGGSTPETIKPAAPNDPSPVFTDGSLVPDRCDCGKYSRNDIGQSGMAVIGGVRHHLAAACLWEPPGGAAEVSG